MTTLDPNPTKVTTFEIECLDDIWRPIFGTCANALCPHTGKSIFASDRGNAHKAYGEEMARINLEFYTNKAYPLKVRIRAK